MFESGMRFPLTMVAMFIGALLWTLVVLLAYSYFEGRFGKTPGKWLVGIRVLGTDLQPCGFGRMGRENGRGCAFTQSARNFRIRCDEV